MKSTLLLALLFCTAIAVSAQKDSGEKIRKYYFVLLTSGPNRNQDSVTAAQIQKAHLANMGILYKQGKLKVAGPFGDEGNWQGVFIFDCATKAETEALLQTDPAIKAGRLNYEIHEWYTMAKGSFIPGKPKGND